MSQTYHSALETVKASENQHLIIKQQFEIAEMFGLETRNKYAIYNEQKQVLFYCTEQSKGILGFILRQYLGHWRRFHLNIYNTQKELVLTARHPFRFFFQELHIVDPQNQVIAKIKQRFSILKKSFDFTNENDEVLFQIRSPFWRIWTFPITSSKSHEEIATISKKWSGLLTEFFTDKDQFHLVFNQQFSDRVETKYKLSMILAAVFVDLNYFEKKAD